MVIFMISAFVVLESTLSGSPKQSRKSALLSSPHTTLHDAFFETLHSAGPDAKNAGGNESAKVCYRLDTPVHHKESIAVPLNTKGYPISRNDDRVNDQPCPRFD